VNDSSAAPKIRWNSCLVFASVLFYVKTNQTNEMKAYQLLHTKLDHFISQMFTQLLETICSDPYFKVRNYACYGLHLLVDLFAQENNHECLLRLAVALCKALEDCDGKMVSCTEAQQHLNFLYSTKLMLIRVLANIR